MTPTRPRRRHSIPLRVATLPPIEHTGPTTDTEEPLRQAFMALTLLVVVFSAIAIAAAASTFTFGPAAPITVVGPASP